MDEREVREKLMTAFQAAFSDDDLQLEDEMSGWDSITFINLIVAVEREFGIGFTTLEIHRMTNVRKFVQTIMARVSCTSEYSTPDL